VTGKADGGTRVDESGREEVKSSQCTTQQTTSRTVGGRTLKKQWSSKWVAPAVAAVSSREPASTKRAITEVALWCK
jgi:hypothetical protein